MESKRYDRNILLFGKEGQAKLGRVSVVIIGVGGLGSAVALHLALLGVKRVYLIDDEELDDSNRNRFIGACDSDPVPGSYKVDLVHRMIRCVNHEVESVPIRVQLISERAFDVVKAADWVFGCLDDDGPRSVLNELCAAYSKPYIDLASDVPEAGVYGGRVCVAMGRDGCLACLGLLDGNDVRRFLASVEDRRREDAIYGINRDVLEKKGPSVSPINGVVAALAATEFMVAVTGMRKPTRLQEYRGFQSKVLVCAPAREHCAICKGLSGQAVAADVERFLKIAHPLEQ